MTLEPTPLTGWTQDLATLCPDADPRAVQAVGDDLLSRWAEPQRRYHTATHLAEVFRALEELAAAGEVGPDDERLARVAAWWHDAVYDPAAADNEERSALLAHDALTSLGLGPDVVATVVVLVRMTADHTVKEPTRPTRALHDADLWILTAPPERYTAYSAQVREEYAAVPDDAFAAARSVILTDLVERDRLYLTDHAHRAWTTSARTNVRAEVARLAPNRVQQRDGVTRSSPG
ncbi:MAG: hypothetical protein M3Y71_06575 [Actinomycetota bacterium]|nr:hypothetical protein [Actinomycetota bacterium]